VGKVSTSSSDRSMLVLLYLLRFLKVTGISYQAIIYPVSIQSIPVEGSRRKFQAAILVIVLRIKFLSSDLLDCPDK
jgi:hypothetical protein